MAKPAEAARPNAAEQREGLFPELSSEFVEVDGKRFQIRQLPYVHEKRFLDLLGPVAERILEAPDGRVYQIILQEVRDVLPDVVAEIFRVTDPTITKQWVEERMVLVDLIDIVRRQLVKNKLMDRVQSFFQSLDRRGVVGARNFLSTQS